MYVSTLAIEVIDRVEFSFNHLNSSDQDVITTTITLALTAVMLVFRLKYT